MHQKHGGPARLTVSSQAVSLMAEWEGSPIFSHLVQTLRFFAAGAGADPKPPGGGGGALDLCSVHRVPSQ